VEGPPRRFRVVELVRHARTAPRQSAVDVEACRWHVNGAGVFYGDHWGWCEDFAVLPETSPGYLVLTTAFSGGVRGAYSRLAVLPPLPANLAVFGGTLGLAVAGGAGQDGPDVQVTFAGQTATLRPGVPVDLGGAGGESLVEPPPDSGHFETGLFQPVPAAVTYTAISYGSLDSRRIAGRGA
jgi:hypothetical protein